MFDVDSTNSFSVVDRQRIEPQEVARWRPDCTGRQQAARKPVGRLRESYTSNMSEFDDDPTGSMPEQGDDDGPESSVELDDSVDWDERNRELFAERQRITLLLEEVGSLDGTDSESTGSVQQIGLRHELLRNYSQIIDTNRGLVSHYVRKFTQQTTPEQWEDYMSAGYEGLLDAINKFDLNKGSFYRFAKIYVKREVQKAVKEDEHSNIGSRDFERRPTVLYTFRQLQDVMVVDSPSADQVAAKSGVPLAQVKRILSARPAESLDVSLVYEKYASRKNQEGKGDTSDLASEESVWLENLRNVLKGLTPLEAKVLVRREGLDGWPGETLEKVAKWLGISREAVRRAEVRARKSTADRGLRVPRPFE